MSRLYEGDKLAPALVEARQRSLATYSLLAESDWTVPCLPIVNPPSWELAHLAWFQELWCLRATAGDPSRRTKPSLLPGADDLFDSSAVAHDLRWSLPYPPRDRILSYMRDSLDATLAALAADGGERRYFFELALLHEDMHGEALLMTLQTLGLPAPPMCPPLAKGVAKGDVAFEGGTFTMGSDANTAGFAFDNELLAHEVAVPAFAISRAVVTQGEFAEFVDDAGYARPEFWPGEAAAWLAQTGLRSPINWRREADAWMTRRFDRWFPIEPDSPMVHVSLHEVLAWCRWAGRRLPTEAQWEFAARNGGAGDRYPWGDEAIDDAGAVTGLDAFSSRQGLHGMMGGVWEWTSTPFHPYPGFHPGPYADYSQPWFHSHFVLRGGSFATRSRLVHNCLRNFYLPGRNDVFAGFRTCPLEPS